MDLLQAAHTYSGIEMALWDLLGKFLNEPVWNSLVTIHAPKPYFSVLFGDEPKQHWNAQKKPSKRLSSSKVWVETNWKRNSFRRWEHFQAAREGLGKEEYCLSILDDFGDDVEKLSLRIKAMEEANVLWFEEPFNAHAIHE